MDEMVDTLIAVHPMGDDMAVATVSAHRRDAVSGDTIAGVYENASAKTSACQRFTTVHSQLESRGEFPQRRPRVCGESVANDLDDDVVGAGVEMRCDRRGGMFGATHAHQ